MEATMEEMRATIKECGRKMRETIQNRVEITKPRIRVEPQKLRSGREERTVAMAVVQRRKKKKCQKKRRQEALGVGERKKKKKKRRETAMVVGIRKKKKQEIEKKREKERKRTRRETVRMIIIFVGERSDNNKSLKYQKKSRASWWLVGRAKLEHASWGMKNGGDEDRRLRKFIGGSFKGGCGFRWEEMEVGERKAAKDGGKGVKHVGGLAMVARKTTEREREMTGKEVRARV